MANALSTKACRSTSTRSIRPRATTVGPSVTDTSKQSRRPLTAVRLATAAIVRPTGVGARCVTDIWAPTVVMPEGRCRAVAATDAASASASSRGVPSTGTSPEPTACAVSASVTVRPTRACRPTGKCDWAENAR